MLPAKVKISDRAFFQELEEEMVLLDMAGEQYWGLDDVGTHMWQLLAEHGDTRVVVEKLRAHYDVDEAALTRDLADLIEKLRAAGLVTVDPPE